MRSDIVQILNSIDPDLRIEFILSEIYEAGVPIENIIVRLRGLFARRYGRDVVNAYETEITERKKTILYLDVNREGIYDALPEGIFHQPTTRKSADKIDDVIEEIKLQRAIERDSRMFFLPFEQEFYSLRLLLELEEKKCIFDPHNVFQNETLIGFWNIPREMDEQQTCNLLYLLPFANLICGNLMLTELCFKSILNVPFRITSANPVMHVAKAETGVSLNETHLGTGLILGNTYQEYIPSLQVMVGPITKKQSWKFSNGGKNKVILDFLIFYFLPFEYDVEVTLDILEEEHDFVLTEDAWDSNLGVTSFI